MKEEINIIEEITTGKFENSFIATFNCNLVFYENLLLKHLLKNGCSNNVVAMDHRQYDDLINNQGSKIQQCGQYYICERMKVNGAFHSKIILLTGKNSGKLLIGSGNTTESGYGRNFELFYKFEYSDKTEEHLQLFQEVVSYLERVSKNYTLGKKISYKSPLKILTESTPWLSKEAIETKERFVHNLDKSILEQLFDVAPKDTNEIIVSSPFFGNNLDVIQRYEQKYTNAKIKILTQSEYTNFPVKYYFSNLKSFKNVSLHKIDSDAGINRAFHAKFIYMSNGKTKMFFAGSSNQSNAALTSVGDESNAETGILSVSDDVEVDFESLWKKFSDSKKVSTPDDLIRYDFEYGSRATKISSIKIEDASIEGLILNVSYISSKKGNGDLILNGNFVSKIQLSESRFTCQVNPKYLEEGSLIVQIKTENDDSNRLWVNNVFIKKINAKDPLSKQVGSISKYVVDFSYINWLIELSPNKTLRESATRDAIQEISLSEKEVDGESIELPEELFFVEEKQAYNSFLQTVSDPAGYKYENDLFTNILNSLLHVIGSVTGKVSKENNVLSDKDSEHEKELSNDDSVQISDGVYKKIQKKIDRLITRISNSLNSEKPIDTSATVNLSQFLAALVWFFDGIKVQIGKDEEYRVDIDSEKYFETSVEVLSRLWSEVNVSDYLVREVGTEKYMYAELARLYPISLSIISFNAWLLRDDDKLIINLEDKQKELIEIFQKIAQNIKKIPQDVRKKILADKEISMVSKQLTSSFERFNLADIDFYKLVNENIDVEKLENQLLSYNKQYQSKILDRKNKILENLKSTAIFQKNKIREIELDMKLLEYKMAECDLKDTEEEIKETKKIIHYLSNLNDATGSVEKLPKTIENFFHL